MKCWTAYAAFSIRMNKSKILTNKHSHWNDLMFQTKFIFNEMIENFQYMPELVCCQGSMS